MSQSVPRVTPLRETPEAFDQKPCQGGGHKLCQGERDLTGPGKLQKFDIRGLFLHKIASVRYPETELVFSFKNSEVCINVLWFILRYFNLTLFLLGETESTPSVFSRITQKRENAFSSNLLFSSRSGWQFAIWNLREDVCMLPWQPLKLIGFKATFLKTNFLNSDFWNGISNY